MKECYLSGMRVRIFLLLIPAFTTLLIAGCTRGCRGGEEPAEVAGPATVREIPPAAVKVPSPAAEVKIKAGSAVSLKILGIKDSIKVGEPSNIRVFSINRKGRVAKNYRGTVVFESTDPKAKLPPKYTFSRINQGNNTFLRGVTLFTPGEQTVTVRDADGLVKPATQKIRVKE